MTDFPMAVEPLAKQDLPTGTVTFLFTDIEGSTRLLQRMGDDYAAVLDRHNAILGDAISRAGGVAFGTEGDAIFASFPDASRAIEAAVEAQRGLLHERWPDDISLRVRMGLHTGAGRLGAGSYVGLDVHRAARIAASGHGGQVILSAVTAELVRSSLPAGVTLRELGRHVLKDMDEPEQIYQLVVEDLPYEFPSLRARPDHVLPAPVTDLVGRETDLASARDLILSSGVRLVTITGTGGTGKTRLALELMRAVRDEFPDGLHYVDLSALTDWQLVLPAVGRALGVVDVAGHDMPAAVAALVGEARMLVVVDNMEQVIEAAAGFSPILELTSGLKFLVTSREPLRLRGEFEYPLNPLPVPDPGVAGAVLADVPSVDLFLRRVRAMNPSFQLQEGNEGAVAELVRRLDGLPLAIELAAPKLRVLSPEALLQLLEGRLDVLAGGSRDLPRRHSTLEAAISWSYDLLDEDARALFRSLGVFSGGWSLAAAEALGGSAGLDRNRLLDMIGDLVAKSMVVFYLDSTGQPRYRLLETLKEFAVLQLSAADEEEKARSAHLNWCQAFVRECEAGYTSSEMPEIMNRIENERHNLRSALDFVLSHPSHIEAGLEIAGQMWIFWDVRGYATEGANWLQRLLATPEASARTRGRALALGAAGWLGRLTPGEGSAEAHFVEATSIWADLDDTRGLAWSTSMQGMITFNSYQPELAREQFEEGARLARSIGDEPLAEIWCNFGLAHVHWMLGAMDKAEELLNRSLEVARRWNHVWATAHAQFSYGILDFLKGDMPSARDRIRESLRLRHEMRDFRGIADCLGGLALVAGTGGDHDTAARLLGAADAQREAAGQVVVPWLQPFFDQVRDAARTGLGEETFALAIAEGRTLARPDAVALAMGAPVAGSLPSP